MKAYLITHSEYAEFLFNAVDPDDPIWSLSSYNARDGEDSSVYQNVDSDPAIYNGVSYSFNQANSYYNEVAASDTLLDGTITLSGETVLPEGSYLQNVVIDYDSPEVNGYEEANLALIVDTKGSYLSTEKKWSVKILVNDSTGLDRYIYTISVGGTTVCQVSRKDTEDPYPATVVASSIYATASIEHSTHDIYVLTIEIDPEGFTDQMLAVSESEFVTTKYLDLGFTVWDLAGNALSTTLSESINKVLTLTEIDLDSLTDSLTKVQIDFTDTYPAHMILSSNVLGSTVAVGYLENIAYLSTLGFYIRFELDPNSVGQLQGDYNLQSDHYTQAVGKINAPGEVIVHAYLDFGGSVYISSLGMYIDLELSSDTKTLIRGLTYGTGTLSEFYIEDEDNLRKVDVTPFVPDVFKDTNIEDLINLWESFMNLLFTPTGKDTRIGVLEKIERITENQNPYTAEEGWLSYLYSEYFSSISALSYENLISILTTLYDGVFDEEDSSSAVQEAAIRTMRNMIASVPILRSHLGTERAYKILGNILGIDLSVAPLWADKSGNLYPLYSEELKEKYLLEDIDSIPEESIASTHFNAVMVNEDLNINGFTNMGTEMEDMLESLIPIHRVLYAINCITILNSYDDKPIEAVYEITAQTETSTLPESILGIYSISDLTVKTKSSGYDILKIPSYPDEVQVSYSVSKSADYPITNNLSSYFLRFYDYMSDSANNLESTGVLYLSILKKSSEDSSYVCYWDLVLKDIKSIRLNRNSVDIEYNRSTLSNVNTVDFLDRFTNISTEYYVAIAFKYYRTEKKWIQSSPYSSWNTEVSDG